MVELRFCLYAPRPNQRCSQQNGFICFAAVWFSPRILDVSSLTGIRKEAVGLNVHNYEGFVWLTRAARMNRTGLELSAVRAHRVDSVAVPIKNSPLLSITPFSANRFWIYSLSTFHIICFSIHGSGPILTQAQSIRQTSIRT